MVTPSGESVTRDETLICPHCGAFCGIDRVTGLTRTHDWPLPTRQVCPGSGQHPRCAESDGRPLWNGQPNPHFYRNQPAPSDGSTDG